MIHILIKVKFIFICLIFISTLSSAKDRLVLGTTTSMRDSGLIEVIQDKFKKKFNYELNLISQGTGQIIQTAIRGDIDIIIVHHEKSELKFIKQGYGKSRLKLMYNDFIIIGPKNNSAKINKDDNLKSVLKKIYNSKSQFVSRGDKSGTNLKELELWKFSNLNVNEFGKWYKNIGQGMGAAINFANSINGYTITDRATWLNHNNRNNLKIFFQNHGMLFNQYSLIPLNPNVVKNTNHNWSTVFLKWILSNEGESIINNFKIKDEQVFYFNGKKIN